MSEDDREMPDEVDLRGGHRGVYYRHPRLVAMGGSPEQIPITTENSAWRRTRMWITHGREFIRGDGR